MRIFDLLSLIFYNLSRRKGRVALTAIGVVIGTAAVVILVSLGNGLQRSATSQLGGIADLTSIMVYPQYDQGPMMASGGSGMGGLGDASRGMSSGLAGMSAGLSTMLSSASATLTSRPAPPSSGWSSSGGHSGGWSGGGFSGGGGFGGGGGGGGGGGFG